MKAREKRVKGGKKKKKKKREDEEKDHITLSTCVCVLAGKFRRWVR